MSERSASEIRLRNESAAEYDTWYLKRGKGSVFIEDNSIFEALDLKADECLLDVGCGTGRITTQLARQCKRCYAIDISDKSIEILKTKNADNLECQTADITIDDIPYNIQFDKILSMQVLQHIEPVHHETVSKKIYNALKDNGIFVCELYNYSGFQRKKEIIRRRQKKITKTGDFYEYRFTPKEFCKIMEKTGYKKIECYGVCNFSRRLMNLFPEKIYKIEKQLHKKAISKYLSYYFIAICQK